MGEGRKYKRVSNRGPPGSRPYVADGWGRERPVKSRPCGCAHAAPASSVLAAHVTASGMGEGRKYKRVSNRGPPGSRSYVADGWGRERPVKSRPPRKRD